LDKVDWHYHENAYVTFILKGKLLKVSKRKRILGDYIRKLRVENALILLGNKERSLTDIALECGFSDQSHFIRCFKVLNKINPSHFRKPLLTETS
jgi:transcriptional regulator GlxA family with amidase domain